MEHHHFDQCLMILNSPGNQVLGNLSSEDYSRVIHVLEDAILSTDLAVYFRCVWGKEKKISKNFQNFFTRFTENVDHFYQPFNPVA